LTSASAAPLCEATGPPTLITIGHDARPLPVSHMRRLMTLTRPIRLLTAVALAGALAFASSVTMADDHTPHLGTAENYAILATSEITNTGATTINGGLALTGTSVSGAPTVTGLYDVDNAAADLAWNDLGSAYGEAAAAVTTTNLTGQDLGTVGVLTPGVYTFDSSAQLTGNLTLDGGGQTNPLFIFQTGSTLITAPGASVTLQNGAGACAIFWQVGSSATFDAATSFQGTVMAAVSITMNAGATIGDGGLNYGGRAMALNGAVTMINNTITAPSDNCAYAAAATPTPTPTPVPTAVPTATPSPIATVAPTAAPSSPASVAPSAPDASESPATGGASPAPASSASDTPRAVTTPRFNIPGISLFPGLPGTPGTTGTTDVPNTSMAPPPAISTPTVTLLALTGLMAVGMSMKVALSRRRS